MSGRSTEMWSAEETTTSKRRADHEGEPTSLRVIVDDQVAMHELPERGEVCLGRGVDAHITVPVLDVSRRHAMLRIEAERLALSDLGSANGTTYRGEPLEPGTWQPVARGDWFCLGDATVVLAAGSMRRLPQRSLGHDELEPAFRRFRSDARRTGEPFSVVTLRCITTRNWIDVTQAMLGAQDHLVVLGEALVVAFLRRDASDEARYVADGIKGHLERLGAFPTVSCRVYPDDGDDLDALVPRLRDEPATRSATVRPAGPLIESDAMRSIYDLVDEVAPSMTSILILGDTGVGKEVLARAIHERSPRRTKAFLAINCAALSENLLESELFGYERGAFTGAVASKAGLLETAEGGTVFLDELGEMPPSTQAKLLRVLEERKVWRLGSLKPLVIDVRILAATNRDLQQRIAAGMFRADLFYRINGLSLTIPPLRDRPEEIEPLVQRFARRAAKELGRPTPSFSLGAQAALRAHAWPGNIRELKNAVERAVLVARDGTVEVEHLPDEVQVPATRPPLASDAPVTAPPATIAISPPAPDDVEEVNLQDEVERLERARIVAALEECQGNQTRAAELLGISRRMLIRRLERYDIPRPRAKRRKKKS